MSRWEHILDRKPQELADYVLDQIADALVVDLREFPPAGIEWLDDAAHARYAQVLERKGKPPLETYRVAVTLAREEMLREYERIDEFCRSPQFRALCPDELEERTAHFLTRPRCADTRWRRRRGAANLDSRTSVSPEAGVRYTVGKPARCTAPCLGAGMKGEGHHDGSGGRQPG